MIGYNCKIDIHFKTFQIVMLIFEVIMLLLKDLTLTKLISLLIIFRQDECLF